MFLEDAMVDSRVGAVDILIENFIKELKKNMIDIGNFMESLEFQGRELEEAIGKLGEKYEDLFFALESPSSDFPRSLIDRLKN